MKMDNKLIKEATHFIEVYSNNKNQIQSIPRVIECMEGVLYNTKRIYGVYTVCVWLIKPKKVG